MGERCTDVGNDRGDFGEDPCPADVRGACHKDLTGLDLIDPADVRYDAHSCCDLACCAGKAFDVRRDGNVRAAPVEVISAVLIREPLGGLETPYYHVRERRVGKILFVVGLARGNVRED